MRTLITVIIITLILTPGCVARKNLKTHASDFFLPPNTAYHFQTVNGIKMFYREAGDTLQPTIVLLHGYPSSSHTYRNLIPLLSSYYHIIAPDNIGSGYSGRLSSGSLRYTFDIVSDYTDELLNKIGVQHYTMYMQDFGAPVGFRLFIKNPKRIDALIIQNANAYLDGLSPDRQGFFKTAYDDTSQKKLDFLYSLTSREAIIKQYLFDLDSSHYSIQSPDSWTHDLHFLEAESARKIQVQLFQDYYSNLLSYPAWQESLRKEQPRTLIVWGAKDKKFIAEGAKAYLRDLPNAELHLLNAGHFALEESPTEIAKLILNFLQLKK